MSRRRFLAPHCLGAVLLAAALAACAGGAPSPAQVARPSGQACYAALGERGAHFARASPPANGPCRVRDGVSLVRGVAVLDRPAVMDCRLALALNDFEREIMQPAAARHFGRKVARIHYLGAYSCRPVAGQARRLSEHAFGLAIDIAGFELDDGAAIVVKDHWRAGGPRAAFLREIARGACRHFSVVLTPNSDRDHWNHIHLDIGRNVLCSP
ncbi:MAG TPA: extensin family protein [Alphaproteobacteria bacterium]|nr:extensin family protein [Alphaproteobacteria bacterium]